MEQKRLWWGLIYDWNKVRQARWPLRNTAPENQGTERT